MYSSYDYGSAMGGGSTVITILSIVIGAASIVAMWKIFAKAGEPGWAAIVPIYNLYVLFKITWGSGLKFLLLLIPFANFVFLIMTYVKRRRAIRPSRRKPLPAAKKRIVCNAAIL